MEITKPVRRTTASVEAPLPVIKRREALWYVLAVGVPLLLVVVWHLLNTRYPNDDAADYFKTAQQIYQRFGSDGLWSGLSAAYLHRGWRPVLFPVVSVPFLLLTGGSVHLTMLLAMTASYAILLTYAYLLCREYLEPCRAALATLLLGSTYWLIASSYYFFSEVWLYACAFAVLYYLKRCALFSSWRYSALLGVWVGITLASKPVEFLMSLGIFFIVMIWVSHSRRIITVRELIVSLSVVIMTAVLPIVYSFAIRPLSKALVLAGLLGVFAAAIVPLLLPFKSGRLYSRPFPVAVSICCLIAGVWWLPMFREYIEYVYTGGFGDMARLYNLGQMDFFKALYFFAATLGGWPLAILFGTATATLGFAAVSDSLKGKAAIKLLAGICIPMIAIPVMVMSLSPSTDPRRATLSFGVLIVVLAIAALQPGIKLAKARYALVSLLAALQVIMISASTFGYYFPGFNGVNAYIPSVPAPIKGGDPSEKTFEELRKLSLENVSIAALSLTMSLQMSSFRERPFDPHMLNGVAERYRSTISFGYPWNFSDLNDGYAALKKGYQMVLLDVSTEAPDKSKITDPHSRLAIDLIERWKSKTLQETGYAQIAQFVVDGKTLVLMKQSNPGILGPQNAALAEKGAVAGATDSQKGFSITALNDGNADTAWGSSETKDDTVFFVTWHKPVKPRLIKLILFSPGSGNHMKEISVVGSVGDGKPDWKVVKARLKGEKIYGAKLIVPNAPDKTIVTIELDANDKNIKNMRAIGIACFSGTQAYTRNYVPIGNGIYVREFGVF
ncbi:MAG: glycosyltransferase family 39 protein [Deltaproteobacteria bacterium]